MPTKRVNEPILEGGIRTANYQNGRLLSAEDLKVDQEATRLRVQRLGEALGAGVVRGLQISGRDRSSEGYLGLEVSAGLAVNGLGDSLLLPVSIALTTNAPAAAPGRSIESGFAPYKPPVPAEEQGSLTLRLLVIAPARGSEEGAPHPAVLAGQDRRYVVDGVQFRLIPFTPPFREEKPSLLRNRLTHTLIYGKGEELRSVLLRCCAGALAPADVPLALIGMIDRQIQFIDMGSLRRGLESGADGFDRFGFGPAELRVARRPQNEAFYRQFQQHLAEIAQSRESGGPIRATDHFRYLPPVGYIEEPLEWQSFLARLTVEEAVLDEAFLQARLEPCWWAEPVDLADPPPLWVYTPPGRRYTLFMRREKAKERIELESGNAIVAEVSTATGTVEPKAIGVTAAGEDGIIYLARLDGRRFRIEPLPAGAYTVWVRAIGFKTAHRRVVLQPGETERFGLVLQPAVPLVPPPAIPEERYPANWLKPWQNRSLAVRVTKRLRSGALPAHLGAWTPMADPPHDLIHWLRSWGGWLAATQPELPIEIDGLRLLVNPDARRRAYLRRPWGYAVYGVGGLRLPLMLAPRLKIRRDLFRRRLLPVSELGPDDPWSKIAALPEVAATRKGQGLIKRFLSLFIEWKGEEKKDESGR